MDVVPVKMGDDILRYPGLLMCWKWVKLGMYPSLFCLETLSGTPSFRISGERGGVGFHMEQVSTKTAELQPSLHLERLAALLTLEEVCASLFGVFYPHALTLFVDGDAKAEFGPRSVFRGDEVSVHWQRSG